MKSSTNTFTIIVRSPGRQHEEAWDVIEPREIVFWKAAASKLANRNYHHKNCVAEVNLDWTPLIRRLARDHNLLIPVRTGKPTSINWYTKLQRPLRLKATCVITGTNNLSSYPWYPKFFIEYFLYEVFMIVNLTFPGSGEFLNFEVQGMDRPSNQRLGLSAFYFSEWMIQTVEGKSPKAKILDLDQTIDWFSKVNPHVTQKAENNTQKALYATYQLCQSNGQIDFVLWLFNALESLLSTKVGENFSGIVRRTNSLLELGEKQKNHCQKILRKLYDLRSSFVHGGYEAPHPLHNEPIDPRLNDDYMKMLLLSIEGFAILGALLQALIEKQIPFVAFEERVIATHNNI
ncbi:HEPN domain-containing protein [Oxalicibacterium solurbis]|uniref:Apea-like HEPN domain-containing protein n=1 Tax=Oxalicibacterium solurbis TaxID=69280 RepID=A0A8J3F5Q8_9BURK|nr:HEPN domain-containing protein [Oxalicibacterium solurbis]GGI53878.1 hypothetical protein GCM10011430_10520 [Oxalicibacterium solurbis]